MCVCVCTHTHLVIVCGCPNLAGLGVVLYLPSALAIGPEVKISSRVVVFVSCFLGMSLQTVQYSLRLVASCCGPVGVQEAPLHCMEEVCTVLWHSGCQSAWMKHYPCPGWLGSRKYLGMTEGSLLTLPVLFCAGNNWGSSVITARVCGSFCRSERNCSPPQDGLPSELVLVFKNLFL